MAILSKYVRVCYTSTESDFLYYCLMNKSVNLHLLKKIPVAIESFFLSIFSSIIYFHYGIFPYVVCLLDYKTTTNDTKEAHYNDDIIYSLLFLQVYEFSWYYFIMFKLNHFKDLCDDNNREHS